MGWTAIKADHKANLCRRHGEAVERLPGTDWSSKQTHSPTEAPTGDRCQPFPGDGRGQERF